MNDTIWQQAEELASIPYEVNIDTEVTADGEGLYLVSNPEIPNLIAYGSTIDEALQNLEDARVDYMYAMLIDNLSIPLPSFFQSVTGGEVGKKNPENRPPVEEQTWEVKPIDNTKQMVSTSLKDYKYGEDESDASIGKDAKESETPIKTQKISFRGSITQLT